MSDDELLEILSRGDERPLIPYSPDDERLLNELIERYREITRGSVKQVPEMRCNIDDFLHYEDLTGRMIVWSEEEQRLVNMNFRYVDPSDSRTHLYFKGLKLVCV